MNKVRIGIHGLGTIGLAHANSLISGLAPRLELAAAASRNPAQRAKLPSVPVFDSLDALIGSGLIDALLICTPHFDHTGSGIKALNAGLHVLVEKPISAQKVDAERLIAAHKGAKTVFAAMFNQRTDPAYRKIRGLIQEGVLGELRRVNWIATEWFRPEIYYSSNPWRATWGGEGGGLLLNQCSHHLDLFQWIFGMPARLRAHCCFGRYHDIEVEDDLTSYLEFQNGATGVFIASTGEAPGTSRVEIAGEKGRLVYEEGNLALWENAVPASQFSRETREVFSKPACTRRDIPLGSSVTSQHAEILQNFAEAILDGAPLIAPAAEGLRSLELANAMLLSSWTEQTVEFPLDGVVYASQLEKKIAQSRFGRKVVTPAAPADLSKSFAR